MKRLLLAGLLLALALRVLPVVGPWVWPRLRRSARRLRQRADFATAVVMVALVASMALRGERLYAAIVAALSIPAIVAAVATVREWMRGE